MVTPSVKPTSLFIEFLQMDKLNATQKEKLKQGEIVETQLTMRYRESRAEQVYTVKIVQGDNGKIIYKSAEADPSKQLPTHIAQAEAEADTGRKEALEGARKLMVEYFLNPNPAVEKRYENIMKCIKRVTNQRP